MHLFATKEKKKTHRFNFWREFRKNKNSFFQTCLQYTSSHYQDAEDLLSEAMCKAHIQMKETKGKITHFHKWFQRIIYNIHLNNTNHNSRLSYLDNIEESINEAGIVTPSPYRLSLEKETEKQLKLGLQSLSPQQGYLCRLYFEGYSYEEIALANNLSVNNLRKIIQLNKETLRKNYNRYISCTPDSKTQKKIHDHLVAYKVNKETHYSFLYRETPAQRLNQKIDALRSYLDKYPFAAEKRFQLASLLYCNGEFETALYNIERLHQEKYFNEDCFEVKFRIHQLVNQSQEASNTAHDAVQKLTEPNVQFHLWKVNKNRDFKRTSIYLNKMIQIEPRNFNLRKLLIESLISKGNFFEAYKEAQKAMEIEADSLELFPILLFGKIKHETFKKALSFTQSQYKNNPHSISSCLYYLHFLVKKGHTKGHPEVDKIYRLLRRKYFWHPDYFLLKALLNKRELSRAFKRRLKDYPDCVLSKHYSRYFAGVITSLPALTTNEKLHFETLKLIYKGA